MRRGARAAAIPVTALLASAALLLPGAPALAAAAAGQLTAAVSTTGALAAPSGVAASKAAVIKRIDLRLRALHRFDNAVSKADRLTDAHKATLHNLISKDIAGLTDLRSKTSAETTVEAIKADAQSMVNDYRVYLLVSHQVHLSVAADAQSAAATKLATTHDKLADAVAALHAAGVDTAAAEQDLADLKAALDKATGALAGQVDTLLAIQPGPDATAIKGQTQSVRTTLHGARADLKTAAAEAKNVYAFVKSQQSSSGTTGS